MPTNENKMPILKYGLKKCSEGVLFITKNITVSFSYSNSITFKQKIPNL